MLTLGLRRWDWVCDLGQGQEKGQANQQLHEPVV